VRHCCSSRPSGKRPCAWVAVNTTSVRNPTSSAVAGLIR
jgi:hypothetical protein